jgi:hypothetical protein
MAVSAGVPERLVRAVREIRTQLTQLDEYTILNRWKIGVLIIRIRTNADGSYGDCPMDYLYSMIGRKRDVVRSYTQVALRFTEAQVRELVAVRHPETGETVSWSVVAALARSKAPWTAAIDLATRGVRERWSSKDFQWYLTRATGKRSCGGRKPKQFGTFESAVDNIIRLTNQVTNAADCCWLPADGGIEHLFATDETATGADPCTALEQAATAIDALENRLRMVAASVDRLRGRVRGLAASCV